MTTKERQARLHEEAIEWAGKELKDIMDRSEQGIYVYACDTHTVCNKRFARMLGLRSPRDWRRVDGESLVDTYVTPDTVGTLVDTYWRAMEDRVGSSVDVTWKRKGGGEVRTNVIMVPLRYKGTDMALHFVTPLE